LTLWFWLFPGWLGFGRSWHATSPLRLLALVPAALGFAVALRCIWDFGWTGRGTPAPVAPPQRLVISGFYRYVRNPMYVGFVTGWLGLWAAIGRPDPGSLIGALVVLVGLDLFVRFYEEPTLRRKFGTEYEAYLRGVPRWIPRLTPWRE
jgi:protein-S-isoprenylcysteine O-methyltransferase Ste14